MSNRWFYEIDGQISGPVEHTRLRLLVDSGMLQPHHKVRKEEHSAWSQAGSVRGLFAPTVMVPAATVVAPVPPPEEDDTPFAGWSAPVSDASVPAGVFDFFGDAETPPDPPPKPAAKPEKPAKPSSSRKTPEPPRRTPPPTPTPPPPPPAPSPPEVDELDIPEALPEV